MNRLEGHCNKVTFIKNIQDGLDLCEVEIDFDTCKCFYDVKELVNFVDSDVQYVIRQDVINGAVETVICEIAKLATVQTVATVENIKLVPADTSRTICNFAMREMRMGEFYPRLTALVASYEIGSSAKSQWFDIHLIDRESKECIVRLFAKHDGSIDDIEDRVKASIGKYVQFDCNYTRFGLQTDELNPLPNEVEMSPEVEVAKQIILKEIASDNGLQEFNASTNIVDILYNIVDGEPGYPLVRIASEIYMINAIDSISTGLDIRAMKRAAITSRGYLLPHNTNFSRPTMNVNKVLRCPNLKTDKEMLLILDPMAEEEPSSTKLTYIKIRNLVNDIISIRRGNEEDNIAAFSPDIMHSLGGLL